MSSLFGPGVMFIFFIFVAALIFLYVMSILWAKKDAKARGANEKSAMLISLIPFAGVLAYVLMRPPLLKIDEKEQDLDIKLKTRQYKKYGICPSCGAEIEDDFIVCPKCNFKLKDICSNCSKPLDKNWNVCPYCATSKNQVISDSFLDKAKAADEVKASSKEDTAVASESKNEKETKVDYKVEDSFSFEKDDVEEAKIDIDNASKPKHHIKNPDQTNTHK